jgi:hypothetical protein
VVVCVELEVKVIRVALVVAAGTGRVYGVGVIFDGVAIGIHKVVVVCVELGIARVIAAGTGKVYGFHVVDAARVPGWAAANDIREHEVRDELGVVGWNVTVAVISPLPGADSAVVLFCTIKLALAAVTIEAAIIGKDEQEHAPVEVVGICTRIAEGSMWILRCRC